MIYSNSRPLSSAERRDSVNERLCEIERRGGTFLMLPNHLPPRFISLPPQQNTPTPAPLDREREGYFTAFRTAL